MIRSRLNLHGKTVLLTGGASGIGAASARVLVARGARVALVDLDEAGLAGVAADLGTAARSFPGSVTDRARLGEIVEEVLAWTGSVDVAWANAGIAAEPPATIATIDEAVFEKVVEVDLLGVWRTVRAALPAVQAAKGHLLLTASTYAFANGMVNAPYAASKSAVESLGRSLRSELAGTGTTAGVLYPGWIETPIVQTSRHVDPVAMQLTSIGFPGPFGKLIPAEQLAEAAVRGIERRAARTIHPRAWIGWSVLRGLVNPVLDAGVDRHRTVQRLVQEIETARIAERAKGDPS
ncbi:MAG: SDR family NAD(P)-dependent oxidoreductase [Solirubrobacteraceae bacterium]|nr:SDR family NAD(P)-dependent oxidoreductase [Solirubrobacteraceae bacterium]